MSVITTNDRGEYEGATWIITANGMKQIAGKDHYRNKIATLCRLQHHALRKRLKGAAAAKCAYWWVKVS
jgi:predicted chitinase